MPEPTGPLIQGGERMGDVATDAVSRIHHNINALALANFKRVVDLEFQKHLYSEPVCSDCISYSAFYDHLFANRENVKM